MFGGIEALVDRVGWTLVHSMWQGVIVAAGLAIALWAMRERSARGRYGVACGAMLVMVGVVVRTFWFLGEGAFVGDGGAGDERAPQAERLNGARGGAVFLGPILDAGGDARGAWSPLTVVVGVWGVGVVVVGAWQAMGYVWLAWMVRRRTEVADERTMAAVMAMREKLGVKRAVRVRRASWVETPAVVGVLRPMVLVPVAVMNGLSVAQVESLIAHELAHVRRWDAVVNAVQNVVQVVMFYHPGVWYVSAKIREEREHCCDDEAAAACGDRLAYARALVSLEERRGLCGNVALAAGGGKLLARVRRILGRGGERGGVRRSLAGVVVALCCVAGPLVVVRSSWAQEKKEDAGPVKPAGGAPKAAGDAAKSGWDADATEVTAEDLKVEAKDYEVGPSDLLTVKIGDLVGPGVETTKMSRVSAKGMISLPHVGEVKVSGLSEAGVEKAVIKAYQDARLIQNPMVTVTVTEPRGNTISVLGNVGRPGQYAVSNPDFRVTDVLAMAGAEAKGGELFVVRPQKKEDGGEAPPRKIRVPLDKLLGGDLKYNMVIRGGDTIVIQGSAPKVVRVVVGKEGLTVDGQATTWEKLPEVLKKIPEGERGRTVLHLSAGSGDLTLKEYAQAKSRAEGLVQAHGLMRVQSAGLVEDGAALPMDAGAEPRSGRRGDAGGGGVYYVGGAAPLPGQYEFRGASRVTLKQALIGAETDLSRGDLTVTVTRRSRGEERLVLDKVTMEKMMGDPKAEGLVLENGDMVLVGNPGAGNAAK